MIPYTFPSVVQEDGTVACRVRLITDVTGLTPWSDYTPIKFVTDAAFVNTYENAGSQALEVLTDLTGLVSGVDYISVYEDTSATKPWSTDIGGYIPCFGDSFSPASLFAANEPGVWYDPSDLTTMYQDAAGTVPVTAVEQPVGLILDKSRGLVLGPELVVNGDFSSDTWWAKSGTTISGGTANWASAASGSWVGRTVSLFTVGSVYSITWTISSISAGGLRLHDGSIFGPTRSAPGTYTEILRATGANFYVISTGASTTATVDNISVKELPGAHASQTTATSRPVLSARVNLLERTEDFANAYWGKNAAVSVVNASGYSTVSVPNTLGTAVNAVFKQSITTIISTTSTLDVRGPVGVSIALADDFGITTAAFTGDWQTITLNATGNGGNHQFYIRTAVANQAYSFDVRKASLVPANQSALPYQRVNTATDYDSGPAFPYYLKFDGVDDSLVTPTITPGVDKAQVFAGVRKLSDAASIVAETSSNADSGGAFYLVGGNNVSSQYSAFAAGTVGGAAAIAKWTPSNFAPDTAVLTSTHDIAGDLSTIRRNGVDGTSATGDKGTGNFLAYPLYIGRRNNASLPFNGHLYPLIVRFGPTLTADQITQTETYVNSKTGAY